MGRMFFTMSNRVKALKATGLPRDAHLIQLAATILWFTAGGAIRIAVRQLSQTWKLRHYDVTDDIIIRKL